MCQILRDSHIISNGYVVAILLIIIGYIIDYIINKQWQKIDDFCST